jgi:molybdopterin-guanine dinucleotide biosynthesis protein A
MMKPERVMAAVLAGGLARRMGGGDKCLKLLAGRPILAHVLERLDGQAERILFNANGDPARFASWHVPVAADVVAGFGGPLVGVLTALEWAAAHAPEITDVVSVPGDGPFLPRDLVRRLVEARAEAGAVLAQAASGGRSNPVVGLWPVTLAAALRHAVVEERIAKVDAWTARYSLATVDFEAARVDPFFNANTQEDLAEAERLLREEASVPGPVTADGASRR